jgi:membrane-associated protease RseP (regulator of RpoE activity)
MIRSLCFALLALGAAGLAGARHASAAPADHACPEGHPFTADLGIGLLQCAGGDCSVNNYRRGEYVHDFSTEPRVWHLRPDGPAAAALREGDFILAIDGVLITTPEGGRRLANLHPGTPIQLLIRRDGRQLTVSLVPTPGCNMPKLVVTAGPSAGPPDGP